MYRNDCRSIINNNPKWKQPKCLTDDWMSNMWYCYTMVCYLAIKRNEALAGVAQWIESQTVNQRITSSIPSQGTCLDCGPDPWMEAHERQPHIDVSLLLFLPPFPSLKINK